MAFTIVSQPIISAGQSLSSALNVNTASTGIRRITFPAAWNSAWLTFQFSSDNVTYSDLYWPNGSLIVVGVNPGGTIMLTNDIWQSGYFKFRSGSPQTPVVQIAQRTFICATD